MSILETAKDLQGSYVYFTPAREATPAPYVAVVGVQKTRVYGLHADAFLTREDAVKLRDALGDAICAQGVREAEKARTLKRGDLVRMSTSETELRAVIRDEDESGEVDVINLAGSAPLGSIQENVFAGIYTRVATPHLF